MSNADDRSGPTTPEPCEAEGLPLLSPGRKSSRRPAPRSSSTSSASSAEEHVHVAYSARTRGALRSQHGGITATDNSSGSKQSRPSARQTRKQVSDDSGVASSSASVIAQPRTSREEWRDVPAARVVPEETYTSNSSIGSKGNLSVDNLLVEDQSPIETQRTGVYEDIFARDQPADPVKILENLIIESGQMSIPLEEIERQLQWANNYEEFYGALHDYLMSYQSIFVVSPIADSVALRNHAAKIDPKSRRSTKPKKRQNLSHSIGSVSYSSIAESFDLVAMEPIYRNRGYNVEMMHSDALHIYAPNSSFDLFILANGCVVWWGMDRLDHWIIDDDFFQDTSIICVKCATERHWQKDIFELFPIWCTFQIDSEQTGRSFQPRAAMEEEALLRFSEKLCFDHYLIPSEDLLRTQVMLTVSASLGRSAKVDYLEHVTQHSQRAVMAIPTEPKSLMDHFSASKRIAQLEGELRMTQMTITTLHESPEFLWDMPWLRGYFILSETQNSVEPRREWYLARSDALFQKLENIRSRRFRLFMMSSDVFLIVLLVLDVVAMLARLSWKMFFRVEE